MIEPEAAAASLRALAGVEALAAELPDIPIIELKGPHVQRRFLPAEQRYPSADVDLLVPRPSARAMRAHLKRTGWTFPPDNGRLWRVDRAAAYVRGHVVVDLHWGLHAGLLSARALEPLEASFWAHADCRSGEIGEPRPEELAAYLVIHNAEQLNRTDKLQLMASVIARSDVDEVSRLLALVGLEALLERIRSALAGREPASALDPLAMRIGPRRAAIVRALRGRAGRS